MTQRKESFYRRYGAENGAKILSSIAKVARAGRTGDPEKIEAARAGDWALVSSIEEVYF